MAKASGCVVSNSYGPLTLLCHYGRTQVLGFDDDSVTIFRTPAAARRAIDTTIRYAINHRRQWHLDFVISAVTVGSREVPDQQ